MTCCERNHSLSSVQTLTVLGPDVAAFRGQSPILVTYPQLKLSLILTLNWGVPWFKHQSLRSPKDQRQWKTLAETSDPVKWYVVYELISFEWAGARLGCVCLKWDKVRRSVTCSASFCLNWRPNGTLEKSADISIMSQFSYVIGEGLTFAWD